MTNIQSIFGLQARQIIEPQYLDVKLFHDQTALWRTRARLALLDYRRVRRDLEKSRHLCERHYLNMELSGIESHFQSIWDIYRTVTHEAWRLDRLYRAGLAQRVYELRGRGSV